MAGSKKKRKIVATVECRMTSSRLPGKVMMKSCGKPLLAHLVDRLRRVKALHEIVLATTVNEADDCIEQLAESLSIPCFRGSEDDVLGRVVQAAGSVNAEVIVEITGDCPLIDPDIISQTLDLFMLNRCDYVTNDTPPSFPMGMDVVVFSRKLSQVADREGKTPADREHVSWFFTRNPERFQLLVLPAPPSLYWPDLRLTLDQREDFELIDAVFKGLYPKNPEFSCGDIINFLKSRRELLELNRKVKQRVPGGII